MYCVNIPIDRALRDQRRLISPARKAGKNTLKRIEDAKKEGYKHWSGCKRMDGYGKCLGHDK